MTRLEAQAWNGQSWIIITVELTIADDSLVLLDQGVPWDAIGFVLVPQLLLFLFDFVFAQLQPWQIRSHPASICNYKSRRAPARSRKIIYMQQVLKERLSTCNPVLNNLMLFQSWESKVEGLESSCVASWFLCAKLHGTMPAMTGLREEPLNGPISFQLTRGRPRDASRDLSRHSNLLAYKWET